ncbi:MAG: MarR family transcriptional regulator [Bacteroidia bacterium]|nr:MarR family transcriptional regulator [Bacteroidia bacterium]
MKTEKVDIDFDNSIGPWLGKTAKIMGYHLQEEFTRAGLDITKEQMIILKKLYERDGLNQNELAELTFRDKSSLTRLVSTLERKGYVRRMRCPEDKRVNFILLTEDGSAMWQRAKPIAQQLIQRMRTDLSEKEVGQFIELLKKIQGNLIHSETARLT